MHSDGEEMYSYVPCKLEKGNENGFKRPVLDIHKYDLQKYGAGSVSFRVQEDSTKEKVVQYWNKLTKDIVNQGYFLGVEIDSPKIIKTIGEGILFGDS